MERGPAALGWSKPFQPNGTAEGYLIPMPTVDELLTATVGRCLPYALGDYACSNVDPIILARVIEHVSGMVYLPQDGVPGTHEESTLYHFFLEELGLTTGATDNIFNPRLGLTLIGKVRDCPARKQKTACFRVSYRVQCGRTAWNCSVIRVV
ncbi:hypothetical protein KFU94_00020 [Chloroflexi bacterium TSY]|nr:hypothetical protein [Chloroflexi bacterium TSY]